VHADLSPNAGDFDNFGNDIMSPEALEAGAGTRPLGSSPNVDRTMFSPPPPGVAPREKTGAMDRTMFSPKPSGFGAPKAPERQPAGGGWDDGPSMESEPVDDPSAATVFSPPPPEMQARAGTSQKKPPGRQGAADFGNIELPSGKRMDDVPTAPATGEDVHPLRRSLTGAQSKSGQFASPPVQDIDHDLPMDEPSDMLKLSEQPVMQPAKSAKASGRGPRAEPIAASSGKDKFTPPKSKREKSKPAEQPKPVKRKK
jgi:hypothetical protein